MTILIKKKIQKSFFRCDVIYKQKVAKNSEKKTSFKDMKALG